MADLHTCRYCGCSQFNACYDEERDVCGWCDADTCTHCADSISILRELVTGTGRAEVVPEGTEVGAIILPMHHAEQLLKILDHPFESQLSRAAVDVIIERRRQIEVEGWTEEHDDDHDPGDIAGAASAYALNAACLLNPFNGTPIEPNPPSSWQWDRMW